MDPALLNELVKQAPATVAVIIIVYIFIRYLKQCGDRDARLEELRTQSTKEIGESCHLFQREMISRHEVIYSRLADSLDKKTNALENLDRKVEGLIKSVTPKS
jgi:nitrate/nitrite-specific signal transduction histidine kinase